MCHDSSRWFALLLRAVSLVVAVGAATGETRADLVPPPSFIFVSSQGSNDVLRYTQATGTYVDRFAFGGGLLVPQGMTFGPEGNLYVANFSGSNIRRYDGQTGAPIGTGTFAFMNQPTSLAFAPNGDLYVGTLSINSVDGKSAQGAVQIFNGTTGASKGYFIAPNQLGSNFQPHSLRFNAQGELLMSDSIGDRILRFDINTGSNLGAFVPTNSGSLDGPTAMAFGPDGDLFVSSYFNNKILRFDGETGASLGTFAEAGALDGPAGLEFGADGFLYVVSNRKNSVVRFNGQTGTFVDVVVSAGSGGLSSPFNLALTPASVPEPTSLVLASIVAAAGWLYRRHPTRPSAAANLHFDRSFAGCLSDGLENSDGV